MAQGQDPHFHQQTISRLWWFISCANLTGMRDAQILGSTLFLCGSVRVSPVEIQVRANRLSRDYPLQCGWASSNELRVWIEQKGRGRLDLLPPWAMKPIFSCLGTWVLLVLGLLDSGWDLDLSPPILKPQTWTRFLILHLANGISQPP